MEDPIFAVLTTWCLVSFFFKEQKVISYFLFVGEKRGKKTNLVTSGWLV